MEIYTRTKVLSIGNFEVDYILVDGKEYEYYDKGEKAFSITSTRGISMETIKEIEKVSRGTFIGVLPLDTSMTSKVASITLDFEKK